MCVWGAFLETSLVYRDQWLTENPSSPDLIHFIKMFFVLFYFLKIVLLPWFAGCISEHSNSQLWPVWLCPCIKDWTSDRKLLLLVCKTQFGWKTWFSVCNGWNHTGPCWDWDDGGRGSVSSSCCALVFYMCCLHLLSHTITQSCSTQAWVWEDVRLIALQPDASVIGLADVLVPITSLPFRLITVFLGNV